MNSMTISVLRGSAAGLLASVVQVAVGAAESALLLPPHEDANIAPRLMDRLARDLGQELPLEAEWALGTVFHFGYGALWGALYGIAEDKLRPPPLVGGAALGGLIYAITFPRWGGAVQTQVERPPEVRTSRMTFVAASVALTYGVATAYATHAMKPRPRRRLFA
jgi:hypothetical protein